MLNPDSHKHVQVEETTELIAVQLAGLAAASALVSAPEVLGAFQASGVYSLHPCSGCLPTRIPCQLPLAAACLIVCKREVQPEDGHCPRRAFARLQEHGVAGTFGSLLGLPWPALLFMGLGTTALTLCALMTPARVELLHAREQSLTLALQH